MGTAVVLLAKLRRERERDVTVGAREMKGGRELVSAASLKSTFDFENFAFSTVF